MGVPLLLQYKSLYAMGIDAGGTHTRAVLIGFSGKKQIIKGFSEKGPGNPASVGWDTALNNILGAAEAAIGQTCVKPDDVLVIGVSAAYTGWGKYVGRYIEALRNIFHNARIHVYHDIHASLLSCFPRGEGIVLIMGTGSSCLGVINGEKALVGGWGHLFDDKAGAYRAGRDGIAAALEYFDGRGEETVLLDYLKKYMNINDVYGVIDRIYMHSDPKGLIAGFAPLVVEACMNKDRVACKIMEDVAFDAVKHIWAAAKRLDITDGIEACIVGGFYRGSKHLLDKMINEASSRLGISIALKEQLVEPVCAVMYPGVSEIIGVDPVELAVNAPDKCRA